MPLLVPLTTMTDVTNTLRNNRLVCVGDLSAGSTAAMRMVALRSLGFDIQAIDSSVGRIRPLSQPLEYLAIKARRPLDTRRINQQILNAVGPCSVLYIDKGVTIRSATLAKVRAAFPHVRIIGYSPDDMLNRNMSSAYFPGTLPLYHTYLTTKSYGVQELLDLGCPQVLFVENAYDPDTHRPLPPASSPIFSCAVGFIGTYEPDRAAILKRLALAGIPVTIRGNLWRPLQWQAIAGLSFLPEVIGDEYSRAICSTRINLAFLRKSNRDLQTTRSIEIPACAGFMLAERTAEHEALFREGVEAEYFAGFDELVQKIKKTLADEPQRKAIALAGRTRCLRDDYTYAGRFRTAFQTLGIPLPGSTLNPSGCAK